MDIEKMLKETPQTDVANILEKAIELSGTQMVVGVALDVAPIALLGVGIQTGLEFARLYPKAAARFLEHARASEMTLASNQGIILKTPTVTERLATAIFSIAEGDDND